MDQAEVRAAGDRFERFVINSQNGGANDGFAICIAQGHAQGGDFAGLHPGFRWLKRDLYELTNRRQQNLPDGRVDFRAVDGDALDEHVRHVPQVERDIDFEAFAIELDAAGLASGGTRDMEEEPDVCVFAVAVDAEFQGFARGVGWLVGDEFERAEIPRGRIGATGTVDVENGGTFRWLAAIEC